MIFASQTSPVHYRLTPQNTGVKLEIWETPPGSSRSDLPFLFRLQYSLPSVAAAQATLKQYLDENGYTLATIDLVADGKILPVDCISIGDTYYREQTQLLPS
ncbi:MAG TPA: hypothetical protein V6D29_18035 [Leptolyngbyaceae cyanobacterium]